MKPTTLKIAGLHKTYPNGLTAVNGVSLTVEPGSIFGLIGPNGAGKSTLLKMACGLLNIDRGSVFCGEQNVSNSPQVAAEFIGLMPDPLGVYTDVSVREYLEFFARVIQLSGAESKERQDKVVDMMALSPWLDSEVETLSAGWQRRIALGRVLLSDAPILLLDEPAAGLDVAARQSLLRIVRTLADEGRTVVVSSHILPELEELADYFGILRDGQWVEPVDGMQSFTRAELKSGFSAPQWKLLSSSNEKVREVLGEAVVDSSGRALLLTAENEEAAAALVKRLVDAGVSIYEFSRSGAQLNSLVLDTLKIEGDSDD